MKPVSRRPVSKSGSAAQFRHNVRTVAGANAARAPMRGGWRL